MFDEEDCDTCEHEDRDSDEYPCDKCFSYKYWMVKLKPKGIDIVMSCGEKHHVDTDQPTVETVSVNGEEIYPPKIQKEIKDEDDVVKLLEILTGDKLRFSSWCTYRENGDIYESSFRDGYSGDSPLRKHIDTVIIPWFKGNRNAYSEYHRVK